MEKGLQSHHLTKPENCCRIMIKIARPFQIRWRIVTTFLTMLFASGINSADGQAIIIKDSTDFYINNLDWRSVHITKTYIPRLELGRDGQALLSLEDKRKNEMLLANIDNPRKTVAIHMILSQLFDSVISSGISYKYDTDSTGVSVIATFCGLSWTIDNLTNEKSISKEDIQRIKKYWTQRLLSIQNVSRYPYP